MIRPTTQTSYCMMRHFFRYWAWWWRKDQGRVVCKDQKCITKLELEDCWKDLPVNSVHMAWQHRTLKGKGPAKLCVCVVVTYRPVHCGLKTAAILYQSKIEQSWDFIQSQNRPNHFAFCRNAWPVGWFHPAMKQSLMCILTPTPSSSIF